MVNRIGLKQELEAMIRRQIYLKERGRDTRYVNEQIKEIEDALFELDALQFEEAIENEH